MRTSYGSKKNRSAIRREMYRKKETRVGPGESVTLFSLLFFKSSGGRDRQVHLRLKKKKKEDAAAVGDKNGYVLMATTSFVVVCVCGQRPPSFQTLVKKKSLRGNRKVFV